MAKKNNSQKLISTLLANKKLTNAQREKIAILMILMVISQRVICLNIVLQKM